MSFHRCFFASQFLFALLVMPAGADVVVPGAFAATEAPSTFSLFTTAAAGRTYQYTINANQLTSVVNHDLTGLQWRLNNAATVNWPTADTTWSFFDIYVGPGVTPSLMSNTFASNFTGGPTQVRSGGLTVTANSFTFGQTGTTPNAFGPAILFTTPYLYTGGDLTIEMRYSAHAGVTNNPAFDGVAASGGPGNGWGVDFSARWTSNSAGVTGSNGNFLVTNLLSQANIPEPSTSVAAFILVSGLLTIVRSRRQ